MICVIKPREGASRRTKNRLSLGGLYYDVAREQPVVCFGNVTVRATLVCSSSTKWVGWLPTSEIQVIKFVEDINEPTS